MGGRYIHQVPVIDIAKTPEVEAKYFRLLFAIPPDFCPTVFLHQNYQGQKPHFVDGVFDQLPNGFGAQGELFWGFC